MDDNQHQIKTCEAILSQLVGIVSVKINSSINPNTTQITKATEYQSAIGGITIEGLAELTDSFISDVRSLVHAHKSAQENAL